MRAWRPTISGSSPSWTAGAATSRTRSASWRWPRPSSSTSWCSIPIRCSPRSSRPRRSSGSSPTTTPLDDLIVQGLHKRPELASAQELVQATLLRLKQARLRPLIPSLAFSYAGGGFGGGQNGFFGNFGTRGDATVSLYWELQNLGFADVAIARRSQAENRAAALRLLKVENQVAADVTTAYKSRLAASHRMAQAAPAVTKGLESLRLNMLNIRRGAGLPAATRPIEVLQPIQALAQARTDYLNAVLAYNRGQFRLYRALGQPALPPAHSPPDTPASRSAVPGATSPRRHQADDSGAPDRDLDMVHDAPRTSPRR